MQYIGSKNRLSKELVPLIQSYINKDTKGYLEPFVGAGTTLKVAKELGRKYIGFDISKEYCDITEKRLNEA